MEIQKIPSMDVRTCSRAKLNLEKSSQYLQMIEKGIQFFASVGEVSSTSTHIKKS